MINAGQLVPSPIYFDRKFGGGDEAIVEAVQISECAVDRFDLVDSSGLLSSLGSPFASVKVGRCAFLRLKMNPFLAGRDTVCSSFIRSRE
jgi:hypothetical protein